MQTALILAGLTAALFERVRTISAKRFVPNGHLIRSPIGQAGYSDAYAAKLIKMAHDHVLTGREADEIGIVLAYIEGEPESTKRFAQWFFPFALPMALKPFQPAANCSANSFNQQINAYLEYIVVECRRAIDLSGKVRAKMQVQNLTPLLLPVVNFKSDALVALLGSLFWNLAQSATPEALIEEETRKFISQHPRVRPPDEERHCYSDELHFFRSPGRHRHGFLRHSQSSTHSPACLLNARSRIGGSFDYTFHFDCMPVRGNTHQHYPNCHGIHCAPGHHQNVNIAPNDYVI
jgi:hypothetical protein